MYKAFLSSSFSEVAPLLPEFIGEELQGKTLSFIPTASLRESVTFYVEAALKTFENWGVKVQILEISSLSSEEIMAALEKNEMIYVSGGNTFFLLQEMKRKGVDRKIIEWMQRGKVYIGESAGSAILSPSISYMRELDDVAAAPDLSSFDALAVIDAYPLPHYGNYPFEAAGKAVLKQYTDLHIIPFNNQQALLVEGGKIRVKTVCTES